MPTFDPEFWSMHWLENRSLRGSQKGRVEIQLKTAADLWRAIDVPLTGEFTTADLVTASGMPRWLAQKAAFCFRRMEFFDVCGKQGNAISYRLTSRTSRAKAA